MECDEQEVCAQYFDWVVSWSRSFARRQATDQYADCESDALLALLLAIRTHDPEKGSLRGWIAGRVHTALIDGLRTRLGRTRTGSHVPRHNFNHPIDLFAPAYGGAHTGVQQQLHETLETQVSGDLDPYEHVEAQRDIAQAWLNLTRLEREVLGAVFWEQVSQREISGRRDVTESATSLVLHKGLRRMKAAYTTVV